MKIIFIHALPACGKLTVAKALMAFLPPKRWRLFHNHLTVDLVASLFDFGTEEFIRAREFIWMQLFQQAMGDPNLDGLVFTFCFEKTADDFFAKFLNLVSTHPSHTSIHFIELTCDHTEMMKRVTSETRKAAKLSDATLYQKLLDDKSIYSGSTIVPNELSLDTTESSPDQTAQRIFSHIQKDLPKQNQSGPDGH